MAIDTDPMATMQRRIAELEKTLANVCRTAGISVEAASYVADGPPVLTPEEIAFGNELVKRIEPDAIREVALGRLGLNQDEHDLLQRVATEFETVAGMDDLRMWDAWPKECPACKHKNDPHNPKGVWWDHDGECSNCGKSPIKALQDRIDRMAPYMPAPAMGESKTDWLEAAYEERDATVKLIDDLIAHLKKEMEPGCLACTENEPCQACMQTARILGTVEGMRKKAKIGPGPTWEQEAKALRNTVAIVAEALGWEDVRQENGDLHLPGGEDMAEAINEIERIKTEALKKLDKLVHHWD